MSSIAGVILAAGMSKRMGSTKQLVKLKGRCLLQWVVNAAVESDLEKIYLVVGHQSERILRNLPHLCQTPKIKILYNADFEKGMSSSVRCGLSAAQQGYENVMFLLGDQPFISPKVINQLLREYKKSDKHICLPVFQGQKGNPVIFGSLFFKQLLTVEGDMGGRQILRDNPEQILQVPISDQKELIDIDTEDDLRSFLHPSRGC